MAEIPPDEGDGRGSVPADDAAVENAADTKGNGTGSAPSGAPQNAVALLGSLQEFAAAAKAGAHPGGRDQPLAEELETILREVARTGATVGYPWDAFRKLLARKVELVLGEMWREKPDLQIQEGDNFERSVVEPITRSLLEPRRDGAPFTVQRLCELLIEPRLFYMSTKKYVYAVQRIVLVTSTEEAITDAPSSNYCTITAPATMVGGLGAPGVPESRKRKLPQELSNGVVAE